jgi:hypothetical protein
MHYFVVPVCRPTRPLTPPYSPSEFAPPPANTSFLRRGLLDDSESSRGHRRTLPPLQGGRLARLPTYPFFGARARAKIGFLLKHIFQPLGHGLRASRGLYRILPCREGTRRQQPLQSHNVFLSPLPKDRPWGTLAENLLRVCQLFPERKFFLSLLRWKIGGHFVHRWL